MMKKRMLSFFLVVVILLALTACAGTGGQPAKTTEASTSTAETTETLPKITIKFAHDAPVASPHNITVDYFKKLVEERSKGRIVVENYPLQQLGSAREMIEGCQMGNIEMTMVPTARYGGFHEPITIIDMPFLFPTEDSVMKLFKSSIAREILDPLEKIGIKALAFYPSSFKNFTNNYKITKPEDFKGLRIRTMESPIIMAYYKAWGANPVPLDPAELYNALQQGVVDGQENPFLSIAEFKVFEVQKYMAISKHSYLEYVCAASKKWWDTLDSDAKKIISDAVLECQDYCYERVKEYNAKYLETIKKGNIEVYELTKEQREAFVKASEPVYVEFRDRIGGELLDKVRAFLAKPENQ